MEKNEILDYLKSKLSTCKAQLEVEIKDRNSYGCYKDSGEFYRLAVAETEGKVEVLEEIIKFIDKQ